MRSGISVFAPFAPARFKLHGLLPRYGFAVLAVAAATALRYWLGQSLGVTPTYITYFPAVMLVAYVSRVGPGAVAVLLSAAAADYFILPTHHSFAISSTGDGLSLAIFMTLGFTVIGLAENRSRRMNDLARIKEHFAEAQAVAQVGSWEFDFANDKLIWSDETYRIFRVPIGTPLLHKEILGTEKVHPEDRQHVHEKWSAALVGGSYHSEHRILSQGETRWVRSRAQIQFDARGNPSLAIGTVQDITQDKRDEEEIAALAFYDPLTRLPNRRLLMDRLKQTLVGCARTGRHAALLFIDLDDFKTLNNTLGHDAGDSLLQLVSCRLVDCVREYDTVARFGGDEFVVLLPELHEDSDQAVAQAANVGKKILDFLERPHLLCGHPHRCTGSVGITLFNSNRQSPEEVLKRADIAMYRAKDDGKRTLRFFSPEMQAAVVERATLERELREALREQSLELHYQPQVNAPGDLIGVEALLRWRHPTRGFLLPVAFIHLAEERGIIDELGQWVLEEACRQLVAWSMDAKTAGLTLSVNVSAHEFHRGDFAQRTLSIIDRYGIDPRRLILELTESVTLQALSEAVDKMNALRARGVRISLDDFGTGYASLSYLKDLPLDQLKLDRHFVQNMLTNARNASIVGMVIALGRSLNLSVIVEGVESEAERGFLEAQGCRFFQGYLFGRPGPVNRLFERPSPNIGNIQ
jgi:diguanylate cyclase (GGDEF)-like protein